MGINEQLFVGYENHLFLAEKKCVLYFSVFSTGSCNVKKKFVNNNQAPHFPQPQMDLGVVT